MVFNNESYKHLIPRVKQVFNQRNRSLKDGYIYIISNKYSTTYKIGKTKNTERKRKKLQTIAPLYVIEYIFPTKAMDTAETVVHKLLVEWRCGEFYSAPLGLIKTIAEIAVEYVNLLEPVDIKNNILFS